MPYAGIGSVRDGMAKDEKNKPETWNDRLNRILEERGIKPAELARQCHISRASINGWTNGTTNNPRLDNFFAACDFLRLRPRWLALGHKPMEPQKDDAPPAYTELIRQIADELEVRSERVQQKLLEFLLEFPEEPERPLAAPARGRAR